jgi:cytochrome b pre-mRNA-processing protein 3
MIVAQARSASFYESFGVPDTVNGRFDLLVLHLAIFLHRLKSEGAEWVPAGQGVFDAFCADMDGNLREMGISDLKVPAEMKRLGEAFYGRVKVYDDALAQPDDAALVRALARNIYEDEASALAVPLAAYVRAAVAALAKQSPGNFVDGLAFPTPPLRAN